MAAATNSALLLPSSNFFTKGSTTKLQSFSPLHEMPIMVTKSRVKCSIEEKSLPSGSKTNMFGSIVATMTTGMTMGRDRAMALVDERMSTEGTGLPFGLSNNTLGWILFGVFGLIWALYFIYVSSLDEDEESDLSL